MIYFTVISLSSEELDLSVLSSFQCTCIPTLYMYMYMYTVRACTCLMINHTKSRYVASVNNNNSPYKFSKV